MRHRVACRKSLPDGDAPPQAILCCGLFLLLTATKRRIHHAPPGLSLLVQLVGRSSFINLHWGYVYCFDDRSSLAFVYTGRDAGFSIVARLEGAEGGIADIEEASPELGERPIGYHPVHVQLSFSWKGTWSWAHRSAQWALGEGGEEGVHTVEQKELLRQLRRAVPITFEALLLSKLGHVYLLHADGERVDVWSGTEMEFTACRAEASQHRISAV